MNWKIGDFKASGLKCDTEGCDYRDDSIKCEDYHKWVNAPCPKCGHSLLTPSDYKLVMRLKAAMMTINIICAPFTIIYYFFKKKRPFEDEKIARLENVKNTWVVKDEG